MVLTEVSFCLKTFFFPPSLVYAQDGGLDRIEVLVQSADFLSSATFLNWICTHELDYDCVTMNWILIGLNWIVSLKCLEMTFVVIWCNITLI